MKSRKHIFLLKMNEHNSSKSVINKNVKMIQLTLLFIEVCTLLKITKFVLIANYNKNIQIKTVCFKKCFQHFLSLSKSSNDHPFCNTVLIQVYIIYPRCGHETFTFMQFVCHFYKGVGNIFLGITDTQLLNECS